MASAAGLEPTTHSLGNCCSILMSYADTVIFDYTLNQKNASSFCLNIRTTIFCVEKLFF